MLVSLGMWSSVVEVPLIWLFGLGSNARSCHDLVVAEMAGYHSNSLLMDTIHPVGELSDL
jgi:hypothetical protein